MTMRLSFIMPAALWLLILLIPLWALAFVTPRHRAPAGRWASLLIRTALITALVLALAGARIVRDTADLTTVFLLDRSDSIAPDVRVRAEAFVREAIAAMRPGDRAAVVAFGANALVERPPTDQDTLGELTAAPVATGTNIQEAVQLGLALLPSETNKRLVLLSDGGENAGDAGAAARLAASRGVPLSYVDLSQPGGVGEAEVSDLHAPASARVGQQLELDVTVESTIAQGAHLRVLGDGQVITEQDVALQAGQNRFTVTAQTNGAGFQSYRAEIVPQSDARPENNAAETLVRVDGPPRVLLVEGQPGVGQNLKDALAAAQVTPELIAPNALPADLGQLGAYDAIVLINVPASALPPTAMTNLPAFVHDLGKGLVMIGGDKSFGLGGYAQTPIEQALPVYMDAPVTQTRPNVALMFVLDKSSSMQACHCRGPSREKDGYYDHKGRTKLEIGKDAVVRSVAVLNKRDVVGVVAFDGSVHWAFQPQSGAEADTVKSAIAPLKPDGHETNIGVGLTAAEDALNAINAKIKHVVVMTDGWSKGEDPLAIVRRMNGEGMTVSVVAEGKGAAPYLQQLADNGGGSFFAVDNMEDALQIFVQETQNISSKFALEHAFTPAYGAASPILAGLDQGLPQLYGYNGTLPKQTATVALADADGSPLLAQWQYGLGRAVAWTSDVQGHWAKDWVSWPAFPRFAAQLVGWVLPNVSSGGLHVDLQSQGARTQIAVTAQDASGQPRSGVDLHAVIVGADGARREVPLEAQAPGAYRGSLESPPQGSYTVQVVATQGEQVVAQESAALIVPYAPEFRLGQSNPALLAQLAQVTGGARLAQPSEAFAPLAQGAGAAQEIALPLILLALILLPIDIAVRRLMVLWRVRSSSQSAGNMRQPRR